MRSEYGKIYKIQDLIALCCLALLGFAILMLEYSTRWLFLGRTEIDFGDLAYVIKCGQGLNSDGGFFSNNGCTSYMYGSINLRIVELLNLNDTSIVIVGIFFFASVSLIFSIIILDLLKINTWLGLFGLIIFFSPPIELILERANLDALIFIILIVSAYVFNDKKKYLSLSLLAISSLMKFYTLPLLLLLSIVLSINKRKRIFSQIYLVLIIIICAIDISHVPNFPWDARNMFGLPVYAEYLSFLLDGPNSHSNRLFATTFGLIIFIFINFCVYRASKKFAIYPAKFSENLSRRKLLIFLFNFFVFFSCFIAGLNIDYRLLFLAVSVLIFLSFGISKPLIVSLCTLLSIVMFTSYNTYIFQPLGDFVIMVLTCYFTLFIGKERKIFLDLFRPILKSH